MNTLSAKSIAWFALRAVIVYTALVLLWLGVGGAYGKIFRSVAEVLLGDVHRDVVIRFQPRDAPSDDLDTDVIFRAKRAPTMGQQPISSKHYGYLPAAVIIALIVASPIPWARRARALAWGLAGVHLYTVVAVLLLLLSVLNGDGPLAVLSMGRAGDAVVDFIAGLLATSTMHFALPIVIWALVAVRFTRDPQTGAWKLT